MSTRTVPNVSPIRIGLLTFNSFVSLKPELDLYRKRDNLIIDALERQDPTALHLALEVLRMVTNSITMTLTSRTELMTTTKLA